MLTPGVSQPECQLLSPLPDTERRITNWSKIRQSWKPRSAVYQQCDLRHVTCCDFIIWLASVPSASLFLIRHISPSVSVNCLMTGGREKIHRWLFMLRRNQHLLPNGALLVYPALGTQGHFQLSRGLHFWS